MEDTNEQVVVRKKRNIKIISSLFIGLLIILTLFSNTLANWNLPKVTTDKPRNDQLTQTFTGSGVLLPQEQEKLSNSSAEAKVQELHVREGDHVKKNQLLVTYDSKKSEQEILDEEATLQIKKLALHDAQEAYNEAQKNKQNEQSEAQPNEGTNTTNLKTDVESKKIEVNVQERKIKNLKEELEKNKKLIAPFDGVVTKINAKKDYLSVREEGDVILFNGSKGFQVNLDIPADLVKHLKVGEKIEVKGNDRSLEGEILEIQNVETDLHESLSGQDGNQVPNQGERTQENLKPQKRLLVKVQGDDLKKGDQVEVQLTNQSAKGILIPNRVIERDHQGPFVYTIEEKKGPLGNAFYIKEQRIKVGESNGQETLVLEGVYEKDQFVLRSSEPLKKGEKVRVKS